MRTAETVLSIIRERGKRGLPLEDIYRQLYNPDLYLRAYARLYHHDGAMTPGATEETVDGMTLAKIENIMELITIYGETDELVNQIIELSLRFQILTQYTALYSDPTDETTAIDKNQNLPNSFALFQNYPNPFNPETVIRYRLPNEQLTYHVTIKIYDLLGRLILVLHDEKHDCNWSFNGFLQL